MRVTVSRKTSQYYEQYVMKRRVPISRLLSVCQRVQVAYSRCFASSPTRDIVVMGGEPVNAVERYVELCDHYERLLRHDLICAEIVHLVASLDDVQKIRYFELLLCGKTPAAHFSGRLLRRVRGWFILEMRNILHRSCSGGGSSATQRRSNCMGGGDTLMVKQPLTRRVIYVTPTIECGEVSGTP